MLSQIRAWLPPYFLLCLPGVMFWDCGFCQWSGKGVVLVGPNFDMG